MSTKRLIIQVSEEQLAWIDSQVEQFSSRASVIRGLINVQMGRKNHGSYNGLIRSE